MTRPLRRILITGARGFIGRACLRLLQLGAVEAAAGDELHATTSSRAHAWQIDAYHAVTWHAVDLLDEAQARELVREVAPTHLLHLAWYTQPGSFWHSPENARWAHASASLLREFIAIGGRRAVLTGSCAEYDWTNGVCVESTTPLRPLTPYGASKVGLLREATAACSEANVSFAWARLFFLYGPGAPVEKFPAAVLHALVEDRPAPCTEGRQLRDFLGVDDAADALVRLLASELQGPVNVASGIPRSLSEIARTAARVLNKEHLLRLGALPMRPGDPPSIVADVTRLRDELHWQPSMSLEAGLRRYLATLAESPSVAADLAPVT